MSKLRVLPLRAFFPGDLEYLRARLDRRVVFTSDPAEADVLLGGTPSPAVLAAARKARVLQVPWTGVDSLDLALLRGGRLTVCNSHSNAPAVAEYALSLLLALLKAIPLHDARLRRGEWLRPSLDKKAEFRPPRRLAGMTVGFVGYGAISRAVAGLLKGFGVTMRAVAAHGLSPAPRPLASLRPASGLGSLLAASDAVFLAAPLTPRTRGLLSARMLARMKPSAVLVNVSRGELLDERALYAALTRGRLAGAALDTWTGHPPASGRRLPSALPFHELSNVVLSPHRAGFLAGELPHLEGAVMNLNRMAAGRRPLNVVDLEAGY